MPHNSQAAQVMFCSPQPNPAWDGAGAPLHPHRGCFWDKPRGSSQNRVCTLGWAQRTFAPSPFLQMGFFVVFWPIWGPSALPCPPQAGTAQNPPCHTSDLAFCLLAPGHAQLPGVYCHTLLSFPLSSISFLLTCPVQMMLRSGFLLLLPLPPEQHKQLQVEPEPMANSLSAT